MNKILVSLTAVLVGTAAIAADCPCANGDCAARPKKQRIIYITAPEPEMYGEPVFTDTVVSNGPDESAPAESCPVAMPEPPMVVMPRAYAGVRFGIHMPSWKNKYHAEPASAILDPDSDHDTYSFEPVFGGSMFAGRYFANDWRGDLEFGYINQFKDSDSGFTFKMSTPYLMVNAYHDFLGGLYLGGGVGFASTKATLDWRYFTSGSRSETRLSFMGGLSAGLTHVLSPYWTLDVRYRIAGYYGPTWTRMAKQPDYNNVSGSDLESLETRVGFILDNSITLGLRYEF